ncbi:hypothetical protein BpHYR1_024905 [Brachionus plicatilis]|uniref:Uncharacterized protein n=1 Tax=Brachionus plicatilis TaxID=10195 RepID=A0A3M7QLV9_BRAPC|nr:hypothetical protein BpHYR1_024905 [Brachionus plicatilis]
MMQEAVEILQPFYDATLELSDVKFLTISVVIPIFAGLKVLLEIQEEDSLFGRIFPFEVFNWNDSKSIIYEQNHLGDVMRDRKKNMFQKQELQLKL